MALQLQLDRAALVLIDVQRDFLHPQGLFARRGWRQMDDAEVATLVQNCQRMIDALHSVRRPVIFLETAFRADYADCAIPPSWSECGLNAESGALVEGSWGARLMDGLTAEARDYVIIKKGHGGYLHTNLDRLLTNLGVQHCIVAGGDVSEAVSDTVRVGASLNYEHFLVEDAVYWPRSPYLALFKHRVEPCSTEAVVRLASAPTATAAVKAGPPYALIMIDMQNDFIHPQGAMQRYGFSSLADEDRERMIDNNRKLIEALRARGWPVVFVKICRRADRIDDAQAPTGRRLRQIPPEAHYVEIGSWGAEYVDGLKPEAQGDIVLEKKAHSAFAFTPLHRIFRNLGVRNCLVSGGAVSGCLSDTVREGVGLGYRMTVISDATYPPRSPYMPMLASRAQIRPTEEVLTEIGAAVPA